MTLGRTGAALLVLTTLPTAAAETGRWIVPDWPAGKEPTFQPVHLYWYVVKACPLVYRTEIGVPEEVNRATALLRTHPHAHPWAPG